MCNKTAVKLSNKHKGNLQVTYIPKILDCYSEGTEKVNQNMMMIKSECHYALLSTHVVILCMCCIVEHGEKLINNLRI
jgi:hypothetical protein